MGANAQTKVPTFAAAEVLTAANTNLLSNGIPVFSGTATRNNAFGGSGEKVLAEGQFAFLEDSNSTQFYDGAAWQSVAGLVLINTTTISAAGTVNVNDVFSANYDNYKMILNGTASTGVSAGIGLRLRVGGADANTNYTYQRQWSYSTTSTADRDVAGTDEFIYCDTNATNKFFVETTLLSPFATEATKIMNTTLSDNNTVGLISSLMCGINTNATSYTGFSLISNGTFSGVLKIYGMAN